MVHEYEFSVYVYIHMKLTSTLPSTHMLWLAQNKFIIFQKPLGLANLLLQKTSTFFFKVKQLMQQSCKAQRRRPPATVRSLNHSPPEPKSTNSEFDLQSNWYR